VQWDNIPDRVFCSQAAVLALKKALPHIYACPGEKQLYSRGTSPGRLFDYLMDRAGCVQVDVASYFQDKALVPLLSIRAVEVSVDSRRDPEYPEDLDPLDFLPDSLSAL